MGRDECKCESTPVLAANSVNCGFELLSFHDRKADAPVFEINFNIQSSIGDRKGRSVKDSARGCQEQEKTDI